jgi:hypothetical protein
MAVFAVSAERLVEMGIEDVGPTYIIITVLSNLASQEKFMLHLHKRIYTKEAASPTSLLAASR